MSRVKILTLIAVCILLTVSLISTADIIEKVHVRTTTIHGLAVMENGTGTIVDINITLISPGDGKVYVSTNPLPIAQEGTYITSATIAAYVASILANKSLNNYTILISADPKVLEIGGPSASAYITCAIYALMMNKTMSDDVVMTGMIMPDGTVGPVGGILEKVRAAAKYGFKVVLIPYGEQYYRRVTGIVNIVREGERLGVQVVPVMDVREALKYFVNADLTIPKLTLSKVLNVNDVYLTLSETLWNKIRERALSKGLEIDNEIKEHVRKSKYYVAATLLYEKLINYYREKFRNLVLSGAFREIEDVIHEIKNNLSSVEKIIRKIKPTTSNLDILIGIYERVLTGKDAVELAEKYFMSGNYLEGTKALALAYARTETLNDWLEILYSIRGGVEIPEDLLKTTAASYLMYAKSTIQYAKTLIAPFGIVTGLEDEVERLEDEFDRKNYIYVLSRSLSIISTINTQLNLALRRQLPIEDVVSKFLSHVKNLAIYNTYESVECGLVSLLSISYIELGDYRLEKNNLASALELYETASYYSMTILSIAKSLGCSFEKLTILNKTSGEVKIKSELPSTEVISFNKSVLAISIIVLIIGIIVPIVMISRLKS